MASSPNRAPAEPAREQIGMAIGTVSETVTVTRIPAGGDLPLAPANPGKDGVLLIRTVIADDLATHSYDLELSAGGETVHRRGGVTRGLGRRTHFISVNHPAFAGATPVTMVLRNHAPEPLFFEDARTVQHFDTWLRRPPQPDDFTMAFLLDEDHLDSSFDGLARISSAPGVRLAAALEVRYANLRMQRLRQRLARVRAGCDRLGIGFVAGMVSWWTGTPGEVRGRLDFQQICWSETDTLDEGQPLRDLLGDRWDLRYGLTTPNMWANTPWQTMNNPELNALRRSRLGPALRAVQDEFGTRTLAFYAENEPAYWAWEQGDHKYPVKRRDLWADFNPHTVAAARTDGVDLDPSNGLSHDERLWLLGNAARYMQDAVDTLTSAAPGSRIYSHALLAQHFPFAGTDRHHPYAEVARVRGGATGLETLWRTDLDGMLRVREWGPWGCVNREENDGMGLEWHLAMLQAEFMLGADLFNSYNWTAINQGGRATGYFNAFLDNLSSGGIVVAGERTGGDRWLPADGWNGLLPVRDENPWGNAIDLELKRPPTPSQASLTVELTAGMPHQVAAYATVQPDDAAASGTTRIHFGDLAIVEQGTTPTLHLTGKGWLVRGGAQGPAFRLVTDLREERRRSQFVTGGR
jgi:hypothetical protein